MSVLDKDRKGLSVSAPIAVKGVANLGIVEIGEGKSDEILPISGVRTAFEGKPHWPKQEPNYSGNYQGDQNPGAGTEHHNFFWNQNTNSSNEINIPNHNFKTGDSVIITNGEGTNRFFTDWVNQIVHHLGSSANDPLAVSRWNIFSYYDVVNDRDVIVFRCWSMTEDPIKNIDVQMPFQMSSVVNGNSGLIYEDGKTVRKEYYVNYGSGSQSGSRMPVGAYSYNLLWNKTGRPDGGNGMWIIQNQSLSFPMSNTSYTSVVGGYSGNYEGGTDTHFVVGHGRSRDYYIINIDENTVKLALTKADALNGNSLTLKADSYFNAPRTGMVRSEEFMKSKNECFDFELNSYPTFGLYKGMNPGYDPKEYVRATDPGGAVSTINSFSWWRPYGTLLLSWDGYKGFSGNDWLTTDSTHQKVDPFIRQRKILSLYGSGSTDPGGLDSRPQAGLRFMNQNRSTKQNTPAHENQHGPVYGHTSTTDNYHTTDSDTDLLHGNAKGWARHEFMTALITCPTEFSWEQVPAFKYQQAVNDNLQNYLDQNILYVRAGGKIKFEGKVRVPEGDTFRQNNFGGMYVTLIYPSTTYGHHTCAIYYIMVKNSADTINLPTGRLSGFAGKNNWSGLQPYNRLPDFILRPHEKTVTEVAVYNAEDFRSFKTISHELDLPADFDSTSLAACKIGLSLYYSENGGNMAGTFQETDTQQPEYDSPIVNGVNSQNVFINALEVGKKYKVKDYAGYGAEVITAIAGTQLGPEMTSDEVKVGRTYTFTNTGGASQEDWSALYIDDLGGGEFSAATLTAEEIEGMQVKIASGTNLGALNGNATIREGGHPINSIIKVENITDVGPSLTAIGAFEPLSGAIQFFSSRLEYIPGD